MDLNLGLHMALAAFGFDIFHDIYICLYLHYLIFLNQKGVDLLHFWHLPEINSELEIVINQQTVRAWLEWPSRRCLAPFIL